MGRVWPTDRNDSYRLGTVFTADCVLAATRTLLPFGVTVFDLEHDQAQRIQLVQTGKRDFEVRIQVADGAAAGPVFHDVIETVKRSFYDNGAGNFTVRKSEALPELAASGKFREVVPLRSTDAQHLA